MTPAFHPLIIFDIFDVAVTKPRCPRFQFPRPDIVADSKTHVPWKSVIFSLKYKAQQNTFRQCPSELTLHMEK